MFSLSRRTSRRAARRGRQRPAGRDSWLEGTFPSIGYVREWWQRKSRLVRHLGQQASAYALFLSLVGSAMIIVILWASGVFGEAGARLSAATGEALAAGGLAIEEVSVTGRTYADKARLQTALGAERGASILHFDIGDARRRLETVEWVDRATIMRLWPNTLRIALVERRPIAIWQLDGRLMLIDRYGQIISGQHLSNFPNLPQIVGVGAASAAADLIELMEEFPDLEARMSAAVRVGGRRWNLRLDNGIDVKLPDQGEREALALLSGIEKRHRLLSRDAAEIDLRVPERLVLKLRKRDVVEFDGADVKT
jgi:cell division protein FtsQ